MQRDGEQGTVDERDDTVAEHALTNDEPDESPVIQFVASRFELSDDLTSLEVETSEHELSYWGLGSNGSDELDDCFKSITARFASVQRTISDPNKQLPECSPIEGDVTSDDAIRLRTATHSFGDLDRISTQIRETQARVGNDLTSKRNHLTTMRSLLSSVVSSVVATISLLLSTSTAGF